MELVESRTLGPARLELFVHFASQISFSNFCQPTGGITFKAGPGFLTSHLPLFKLSYPGYEFEAWVCDGMIFVSRNGVSQHSEQYMGNETRRVVIQWNIDWISCGVWPSRSTEEVIGQQTKTASTPITLPPAELVKLLRTENLLSNSSYKNIDDVFSTVFDCLRLCEHDIRRHGGERFVWGKGGDQMRPIDESEISRYVASFLTSHGAARNFDVTCEPVAGGGNVDFYVVAPVLTTGLAKIAIEAKKADSAKLAHGLQVQLPEYMNRIGTTHGIYLTYWLKSSNYPYPPQRDFDELVIEVLYKIPKSPNVRLAALDLSFGPPPSKTTA